MSLKSLSTRSFLAGLGLSPLAVTSAFPAAVFPNEGLMSSTVFSGFSFACPWISTVSSPLAAVKCYQRIPATRCHLLQTYKACLSFYSHYRDYVDREREMCHRMFAPCGSSSSVGRNWRYKAKHAWEDSGFCPLGKISSSASLCDQWLSPLRTA